MPYCPESLNGFPGFLCLPDGRTLGAGLFIFSRGSATNDVFLEIITAIAAVQTESFPMTAALKVRTGHLC